MPKTWFFEIYSDTPEEEASNLMEHSTLTLDLSSDDEADALKQKDDRGKENTPPEGYDAPTASLSPSAEVQEGDIFTTPCQIKKKGDPMMLVRKKILKDVDEMDDGARSPLDDLETEPFYPDGLGKESYVVVDGEGAEEKPKGLGMELKDLFAVPAGGEKKEEVVEDVKKGGVTVWEDAA